MKEISVSSAYKPLVQMKWSCAACSVLWILHRRGYWVDQEIIAKEIGVLIPKNHQNKFNIKMPTTSNPDDYGAPNLIGTDAHLVNEFLDKHKILLQMVPHKIGTIKKPREFLIKHLQQNHDVMLSFHHAGLKQEGGGHVVILAKMTDEADPTITIGDPSQLYPKFWKTKLSKLIKSMSAQYDNIERGFYVFEPKDGN